MQWTSLHNHSKFSILDGLSKFKQMIEKCKENSYDAIALTDHGNITGAIEFCSEISKAGIKPIIGSELYLSPMDCSIKVQENRRCSHLCVLAKNQDGWKDLIQITSHANLPSHFYYRPRLDLNTLATLNTKQNLIAFSGHPGSDMWNIMEGFNTDDAYKRACHMAKKYQNIFGKENFFIEIQTITGSNPDKIEILRKVAKDLGIKPVATADSHYINKSQALIQRVLLCSSLKTTLKQVYNDIDNDDFGLSSFFTQDCFHLPNNDEIAKFNTEEEIATTSEIAGMCDKYSILKQPMVPKFECPYGLSADDYLHKLCNDGEFIYLTEGKRLDGRYRYRLLHELEVIKTAGLANYFLVVQDIIQWCKKQGVLVGPGRGSVGGSLIAYLLGITSVDPIEYGLIFERFYNAGRNTKDNVSLPDIDIDFPSGFRKYVIEYIIRKYGKENVAQIATYSELQGKSAFKEVLRVHGFNYKLSDMLTSKIPDYARISDKLEESKEDSILMWTLKHEPTALQESGKLLDDGTIDGPYAYHLNVAIQIEGALKSRGRHAAAVVIGSEPLADISPIVYEGDEPIVVFDKDGCEKIGLLKMDILATTVLDKLMAFNSLLKNGYIEDFKNPFEENSNV